MNERITDAKEMKEQDKPIISSPALLDQSSNFYFEGDEKWSIITIFSLSFRSQ